MNKEQEDICYGGLKGYGKTYCEMIRLQQENKELHNKIDKYESLEQSLTFIKNRVKQGMTQENINKCAIQLVNSYLKDSDVDEK